MILRDFSIELAPTRLRARGFFVDMATVFEDFVVIALREALGLTEHSFPQGAHGRRLTLDEGGRIRLEPDFSWWDGGACVFVGDVKYKRTPAAAGVKHPDLYQLFAYAQATGLSTGLLIYAAGEDPEGAYPIVRSDKVLRVRTLDLAQEPSETLEQVAAIAETIRSERAFRQLPIPLSAVA